MALQVKPLCAMPASHRGASSAATAPCPTDSVGKAVEQGPSAGQLLPSAWTSADCCGRLASEPAHRNLQLCQMNVSKK